jgi:hypothetical protein
MTSVGAAAITAILAALLAAAGTYISTRRDLQLKFDASLRDLRIDAYKTLWAHLAVLRKYAREERLTGEDLRKLSGDLSTWYFDTGGIFLSPDTRTAYFNLQDVLEVLSERNRLDDDDEEFVRLVSSRLRTAMTFDVGTRRTFVFRGDEPADTYLKGKEYATDGTRTLRPVYKRRWRHPSWPGVRSLVRPVEPVPDYFIGETRVGPDVQFAIEGPNVYQGPKGWQRGKPPPGDVVRWRRKSDDVQA